MKIIGKSDPKLHNMAHALSLSVFINIAFKGTNDFFIIFQSIQKLMKKIFKKFV